MNSLSISSTDIARDYDKRHDHVLRDIDTFLKKNTGFESDFVISSYTSSRGKIYRQYLLSEKAVDILKNKYKYNTRSARFEYKCLNEIKDFCDEMNIEYVEQFSVCKYKIDLYIVKHNIAIEFDEYEHKYKKSYDIDRQKYIEEKINCKFIRFNEGISCGRMIAILVKELNTNINGRK